MEELLVHWYASHLYLQLQAVLPEGCLPFGIGDNASNPLEQRVKEALWLCSTWSAHWVCVMANAWSASWVWKYLGHFSHMRVWADRLLHKRLSYRCLSAEQFWLWSTRVDTSPKVQDPFMRHCFTQTPKKPPLQIQCLTALVASFLRVYLREQNYCIPWFVYLPYRLTKKDTSCIRQGVPPVHACHSIRAET